MFNACTSLQYQDASSTNINLSLWDVTNITNMRGMFQLCDKFNGVLWKTLKSGNVDLRNMFYGAGNFNNGGSNVGIQQWNTDDVTRMDSMFQSAFAFNSDISAWDTGNVTNMEFMFAGNAVSNHIFNQPIGGWNVDNVNNMVGMFSHNTSFDQNISGWNVSKWSQVNNTDFPLSNAVTPSLNLSTSNYNALLLAWDQYTYPNWPVGNTVNFGSSQYSLVSPGPGNLYTNARNSLIAKWGAIADGGGI
jgi:surface protein